MSNFLANFNVSESQNIVADNHWQSIQPSITRVIQSINSTMHSTWSIRSNQFHGHHFSLPITTCSLIYIQLIANHLIHLCHIVQAASNKVSFSAAFKASSISPIRCYAIFYIMIYHLQCKQAHPELWRLGSLSSTNQKFQEQFLALGGL